MREVFPIYPAGAGPVLMLVPLAVILVGLVVLFGWLVQSSRHMWFEVTGDGLRIGGAMYGRSIPRSQLRAAEARVIDLKRERAFAPTMRTNGAGLPGFLAGWVRLRNGEKALAFITQPVVVYVPTTQGYSVLMSARDPEGLRRSLNRGGEGDR